MEFRKFNSLENSYRENFIHKIREQGLENEKWVVTEKLHGCNYSFHVKVENLLTAEVKPAKRSSFIQSDEKFYNHIPVYEKYVHKISSLAQQLIKDNDLTDGVVVVYGELFGGNIQGGMGYSLEQDFNAFDITLNGTPINKLEMKYYCDSFNIPSAPSLGIYHSLSEALEHNEVFVTKRLRDGFDENNPQSEAEGVVIEPVSPKFLPSGERVYIKKKTQRFAERKSNKTPKVEVNLPENLKALYLTAQEYITENRYNAVVSKEGEVNIKMIGKISVFMTQDILEDMQKDGYDLQGMLEREEFTELEFKKFKKEFNSEVTNFVRPLLLKLM